MRRWQVVRQVVRQLAALLWIGLGGFAAWAAGVTSATPDGYMQPAQRPQDAAPSFRVTAVCTGPEKLGSDESFGIVGFEVDRHAGSVVLAWQAFDRNGRMRDEGRERLSSCTVEGPVNWRCGGQPVTFSGVTTISEAHTMKDGMYRHEQRQGGGPERAVNCRMKVE